ncbi:hypothetical protein [Mycobacterium sp. 1274756.6]|uniref:hypothetical protein n=1 Tax=Mycobacterium sp. 1274756.6 TaxID=1834076 RepID=UPI000B01FAB8|nr:hypothetical protein [Mycobacterium sp. 1274756.6]
MTKRAAVRAMAVAERQEFADLLAGLSPAQWAAGRGPQVRGRAEALLLTMTGRVAAVAAELAGEGVTLLRW